ncbi:MAG: class I SAM-dependent methyltransferase, partial [Candidatus Sericytochromatia bacterium]|nr:class I SAM-dependent methyltransferase [Candidatus Sericytochromatia bacterium]
MSYPAYSRYAEIYDRDQVYFSRETAAYLPRLLKARGWHGQRILDLACGTGTLALELARQDYDVWGVDLSADMLHQAEKKAQLSKQPVVFRRQDMRRLAMPERFDLVVCSYDSMNYILELSEIATVCQRVYEHLAPEGLFYFDMNSVHALADIWGTKVEAEDDEELPYIWTTVFEPGKCLSSLTATFFVRRGDRYEKISEVHVERGYPQAD